jgi:hypothetical protein
MRERMTEVQGDGFLLVAMWFALVMITALQ